MPLAGQQRQPRRVVVLDGQRHGADGLDMSGHGGDADLLVIRVGVLLGGDGHHARAFPLAGRDGEDSVIAEGVVSLLGGGGARRRRRRHHHLDVLGRDPVQRGRHRGRGHRLRGVNVRFLDGGMVQGQGDPGQPAGSAHAGLHPRPELTECVHRPHPVARRRTPLLVGVVVGRLPHRGDELPNAPFRVQPLHLVVGHVQAVQFLYRLPADGVAVDDSGVRISLRPGPFRYGRSIR